MEFDWDPLKAAGNQRKHGVSFSEAATIFGDVLASTAADPEHSADESRWITIGMSSQNRVLMVAHTDRAGALRIISARVLTRKERKIYETARQESN